VSPIGTHIQLLTATPTLCPQTPTSWTTDVGTIWRAPVCDSVHYGAQDRCRGWQL